MGSVRDYYNDHVEDEDQRLNEHPFEIPLTMHFVEKYLKPGATIFDVACGTGRIAALLLDKGYSVGMNDLSDKNIDLVKERLEFHPNVIFIERADVLTSTKWWHQTWDCIFILGPLYHILSKNKRLQLLKTACDNLKPGGLLFSSYMTRVGAMVYGLKHNPEGILYPDGARKLWETGTDDKFVNATEYFTHAYFAHPEEINPLSEQAGLIPLHLAGAEGLFGERFELYHALEDHLKRDWLKFVIDYCEDKHLLQLSKHLLSIAKKPIK
jgi:S-adenosylmethionine-dependent methyltransferase